MCAEKKINSIDLPLKQYLNENIYNRPKASARLLHQQSKKKRRVQIRLANSKQIKPITRQTSLSNNHDTNMVF